MSLDLTENRSIALSRDDSMTEQNSAVPKTPLPARERTSAAGDMISRHMDEPPLAAAYQEYTNSQKSPRQEGKEKDFQGPRLPPVEESIQARLERLGRQRPEVFESIYAEIGFVFSISMSQVLSVNLPSH